MAEQTKHHRGRRKKKGGFLTTLIFCVAIAIFCISGYKLFGILKGYTDGRSEYEKITDIAIENEDEEKFRVNFDELLEINPDTIGWIRFYPEPEIINYPIVQGDDNDYYLKKTFSANENTLGAIFLNVYNRPDFSDKNSIIYGHRMKDGSMFRKLEDYKDKEFWEANPYFYIYTPDGKELTYHIYSAGTVLDTADTYLTSFGSDADFQDFIKYTKSTADYDTGVEVTTDDRVVTLSTCTASSDNHRYVIHGVLEKSVMLED